MEYPIIDSYLKHNLESNILILNPIALNDNPCESCDFSVGAYIASIFECNFKRSNFEMSMNLYLLKKRIVIWRNDVNMIILNMKDKDVNDIKNSFEKIYKDHILINLKLKQYIIYKCIKIKL